MTRKGLLQMGALVAGFLMTLAPIEAGAVENPLAEQGEAIFQAKCSACHTIGGGDRPMGPDLAGVSELREQSWLADFIRNPGRLIAEGDPTALELLKRFNNFTMPSFKLTDKELSAVLAYLAAPAEAQHHAAPETALEPAAATLAPPPSGDAKRGEGLYVGTASFAKAGAPCLACHGIAGAGMGKAAGANYGPDLTGLWEDYGAEGVASILETLPFPSMEPIYATRPLTEEERADLAAFLKQVSGHQTASIGGRLTVDVIIATAVFFGLIGVLGWRRLRAVRQPLVEKARKGKVK